jgi:hypothetical protein
MKVSIKLGEIYRRYNDPAYNYKYLCTFIRDVVTCERSTYYPFVPNCGNELRLLFAEYFTPQPNWELASSDTVNSWFIHGVYNDPLIPDDCHLKLIDGFRIDFPDAYIDGRALRNYMMEHVLSKNPDALIEFYAICAY